MANQSANYPTLIDVARRLNPSGSIETEVVEASNIVNQVLADAYWMECNDGSSHVTTVRNLLPTVARMRAYKGYTPSKSVTYQAASATGSVGVMSQIDERVLRVQTDQEAFMVSESFPAIESLNQTVASDIFYANSKTDADSPMGLGPQFSAHSGTDITKSSYNVIDGGGTGNTNTSIWLIGWGNRTVHMIYPKGTVGGIKHENRGKLHADDGNGGTIFLWTHTWDWSYGVVVRDWRFAIRICNIDIASIMAGAANQVDIMKLMVQGYNKARRFMSPGTAPVNTPMATRWAFYANNDVISYLDTQTYAKISNRMIDYKDDVTGKNVLTFRGIPIRDCEAILDTEATVPHA